MGVKALGLGNSPDEAAEILELALAAEKAPENATLLFRLAEACFARGLLADAKKWYSRRAELSGAKEETWYCLYQVAVLTHFTQGATPEAIIQAYARAYDFLPSRLEPLAPLARIYRENGAHETAYQLSKLGIGAVVPSKGFGFDLSIYELILPLEFVYACQALGREAEATLIALRLLEHPQLPADCRTRLEALSGVQGILLTLPLGGSVSGGFLRSLCPGWWERQAE
ncbi:MAG: hypothetical protein JNN07_19930 [Verrucomicrobiales bacterium]|nr:hypothetical protein [Verrucomicrobiales bacterium]